MALLLVVGAVCLLVGSIFAWSKPLFPLLAGFLLAYLAHPLASWFARHGWPRMLGFVVVLLLLVCVALLVLLVFVPAVVQELAAAAARLPTWQEVLHERLEPLLADVQRRYPEAFQVVSAKVTAYLQEKLPQLAPKLAAWLGQVLLSSVAFVSSLLGLVVALVIGAYLTVDFPKFLTTLRLLVPRSVLPTVEVVALEVHRVLGAFLKGQLLVALALGVMYTLGLWLVGAPLALVVGPLAGLLSLVPYLGLVVGAGLAMFLTLLERQDLLHPLLALAVFVGAQNLEGWVLTPKLVGKEVGLHPVWVLVALLLGGELFGITGVVVA
ncbi:MAG: AI-2E family transporter, partial [Thermoanaerobaculum sp.]|nr:AI-2E family transporter [Thermoanaerobaculum sp.]